MRDIKISSSSHGQESAYSLWPSQKGWRWKGDRLRQVPKSAILATHARSRMCGSSCCFATPLSGHNKWRQICFHFMRFLLTRRTLAMGQAGSSSWLEHNTTGHLLLLLLLLCDEFIVRRLSLTMLTHMYVCMYMTH